VTLGIGVAAASKPIILKKVKDIIANTNVDVSAQWEGEIRIKASYGKPKNAPKNSLASFAFISAGGDDPLQPIQDALQAAKSANLFPAGETWDIALQN
jgi:hypothetical protein